LTPRIQGNNKTEKLKTDLLSAFDTVASHFVTSFSSLSTALARIKAPGESLPLSRVYLAILVGPSLGTAKSKVFYGVDKFQAQIWGSLDELEREVKGDEESGDEYPEESEDESTGEEEEEEVGSEGSEGNSDRKRGLEDIEDGENDCAGNNSDASKDEGNDAQKCQHHLPTPNWSYAEEQRFLQIADRLLARTLATADANGYGISNEMCTS